MPATAGAAVGLPPLLLVGGGKMGGAMLAGWRKAGLAPSVVVTPHPEAFAGGGEGITVVAEAAAIPADFRPAVVILAVKPQKAAEVLPLYGRFAADAVFLSVMAGQRLAAMAAAIGGSPRVIRAMPNTPAAIGQGITAAIAGPGVTPAERDLSTRLLAAAGLVAWIDEEGQMDAVTAISGSGPAYVFLLAELLERAGISQGLPQSLARQLARQTVIGAGALLAARPEEAAELRRAVTSPRGTTEAALAILMDDAAWPRAMEEAVTAGARRSRELST